MSRSLGKPSFYRTTAVLMAGELGALQAQQPQAPPGPGRPKRRRNATSRSQQGAEKQCARRADAPVSRCLSVPGGAPRLSVVNAIALMALMCSAAFADTVSDTLTITRPGFPTEILTITEGEEAAVPPGQFAHKQTSFLAPHATYCLVGAGCFGSLGVSVYEPGTTTFSDSVLATENSFTTALDQITLSLSSDQDTGTGPDLG